MTKTKTPKHHDTTGSQCWKSNQPTKQPNEQANHTATHEKAWDKKDTKET